MAACKWLWVLVDQVGTLPVLGKVVGSPNGEPRTFPNKLGTLENLKPFLVKVLENLEPFLVKALKDLEPFLVKALKDLEPFLVKVYTGYCHWDRTLFPV